MKSKYPLIEELGLKVQYNSETDPMQLQATRYDGVFADHLEALLQKATVVYGHYRNGEIVYAESGFNSDAISSGLIFNIKPIVRKCEHSIKEYKVNNPLMTVRCSDCGVKLVPEWKEVEG